MSSKAKAHAEKEAFAAMPESDLLELRIRLAKEVNILVNEKNTKAATIQRVTAELVARRSPDIDRMAITDHAVVRYIERLEHRDLEGVRTKILEMVSRSIRRDAEFLDDPVTGMVIACREGSNSVATILDKEAIRRPTPKLVETTTLTGGDRT